MKWLFPEWKARVEQRLNRRGRYAPYGDLQFADRVEVNKFYDSLKGEYLYPVDAQGRLTKGRVKKKDESP